MPQRLFSTFPGGRPGIGLLLLRVLVGITALLQGGSYLSNINHASLTAWIAGLLTIVSGIGLLIGFFTPVAAVIVAIGAIATAFSWIPGPTPNLLEAALPTLFAVAVSAAIAFLGPGAFSVDGRMFGRREIIIPHSSRRSPQ